MKVNRRQSFSIQILQIVDAVLIWVAFAVASQLRVPFLDLLIHWGLQVWKQDIPGLREITWMLSILIPFTPLALEMFGFYRNPLRQRMANSLWQIVRAFVVLAAAIGLMVVFFKFNASSRAVLVLAIPLAGFLLMARAWVVVHYARHRSLAEDLKESIVLAGAPEDIEQWLSEVPAEERALWKIVGKHDLRSDDWQGFQRLLEDKAVERVIFAAKHSEFVRLGTGIEICESRGIEAWVAANFLQTQLARPTFDSVAGRPMLVLRSTPEISWELLAKELIDRTGALILIIASLPLWAVVAIGIKLQSPGPVFFMQNRAGRYGRPFRMWKFRSMLVDAEKRLEELKQQSGNQMSGPVFKLENDPRIFPLGRIIRKFSIDELPQLINVLKGDMSLVGPRPMAIYELPKIERSEQRRKLSVKPGLTCIWQVSGRNNISDFDDWVRLDLQYIDNWSLWLDFKILLKTIPAVLFAKGAK